MILQEYLHWIKNFGSDVCFKYNAILHTYLYKLIIKGELFMKTIIKSILVGLVVAIIGNIFSEIYRIVFNGLGVDTGRILGIGTYICIVIVVCTGIIITQVNKRK